MANEDKSVYQDEPQLYNKVIQAVPKPDVGIGVDTQQTIFDNIAQQGTSSHLDISQLESFTTISNSRDQIYKLLDMMSQDVTISSVLETYAEDATETNEYGQVVWCESSSVEVQKYITFLLDTMNIDKHIYKWVHGLCKYGDIYLRLYRESDVEQDDLFSKKIDKRKRAKKLNEDVKMRVYAKNDHYINYLEMESNPAEIFELTKFGKTYAYIKAPTTMNNTQNALSSMGTAYATVPHYSFKRSDVLLCGPTDYVHACLEDNSSRTPETVNIMKDNSTDLGTYTVKRGQSLLYNTFSKWRQLQLLENSVLLNRITKSAIVRVIGVEVGDMPKEMVGPHLQGIKSMIEQKTAMNAGKSMTEYTNPGPIENNIYVPTHGGKGAITTSEIGGQVDIKSLADLSYYQDQLFGGLRVPKQYFGIVDDAAGFSGGSSLSIISSRYGKMVKRIQNTMLQALTDAIHLLLLDRGLDSYVNNFTLRMQAPTTQEEVDRRESISSKTNFVSDVMGLLSDIEDKETRLQIINALLSNVLTNADVVQLIQGEITKIQAEKAELKQQQEETTSEEVEAQESSDFNESDIFGGLTDSVDETTESTEPVGEYGSDEFIQPLENVSTDYLPSPDELGQDMTTV